MPTVNDVIRAMAVIAPPQLALDGDPIGLHAGSPDAPVSRIMLSLDASLGAVEDAMRARAEMLVVHHPRFFRGLSTLADTDPAGRRAAVIARSGLAVFSAHTNLDLAEGGTNDLLAKAAGIAEPRLVKREKSEQLLKLAVFTPASHVREVLRALTGAGAGAIGEYSDCTFRTRGTGTFRCGPGANPYIGRPGSFEEVDEFRLETVFGEFSRRRVLDAMISAHPYEEAAYDVYPLLGSARDYGLGRVGDLSAAETLADFAARVARNCGSAMAQCRGKPGRKIRRVAVWAGAGVDVKAMLGCGADVVVAGEVGYHEVEAFADAGTALLTLGHGHSEDMVLKPLSRRLKILLPEITAIHISKNGGMPMWNVK